MWTMRSGERLRARDWSRNSTALVGQTGQPCRVRRLPEQGGLRLRRRRRAGRRARRRPRRWRRRCARGRGRPAWASAAEAESSVPTAAAARCQARRSTSRSGRAAASARWTRMRCSAERLGVDGRTGERVAELELAAAEPDESGLLGGGKGGQIGAELGRRAFDDGQVAGVTRGGEDERAPVGLPERVGPAQERARDLGRDEHRSADGRELKLLGLGRQLEQGERIPAGHVVKLGAQLGRDAGTAAPRSRRCVKPAE